MDTEASDAHVMLGGPTFFLNQQVGSLLLYPAQNDGICIILEEARCKKYQAFRSMRTVLSTNFSLLSMYTCLVRIHPKASSELCTGSQPHEDPLLTTIRLAWSISNFMSCLYVKGAVGFEKGG
jgi:hypothetical protein